MARRASLNEVKLPSNAVKGLPLEKLKALNEVDSSSFYDYFDSLTLEDIKNVQRRRKELLSENREMALKNCQHQPEFEELKRELRRKCSEANELRKDYERNYEELKKLSKQMDPSNLLKDLQKKAKTAEQSSEDLADRYVAGKPVDDFVEEFMHLRTQYWLRKVKAEKLDELIKSRQPHPHPRPRPKRPPNPVVNPPYLAPMPVSHPTQSLPPASQARMPSPTSPAQSLPPSQPQPMPHPPSNHPFPAAAFTPYRAPRPPQQPSYPRYYTPAQPPRPGGPHNIGFRS